MRWNLKERLKNNMESMREKEAESKMNKSTRFSQMKNSKFYLMVLILLSFLLFSNFVYAGTIPMVSEWNIPAQNTTITLPIPSNSRNVFTVDWGDSVVESFNSTSSFPSHTYTEAGIHTVQITGVVDTFGYTSTSSAIGTNYESFIKYLIGISQFGELEATRYGFSQCTNLKTLPSVTENSFINVTDMSYIFYGCTGLTSTIPSNIFFSASSAQNFNSAFEGCSNLTGTVPSILFTIATEATSFDRTFYNCSNLTGANINTSVIGTEMFYGCNKLVNITIGNNVKTINTNAFLTTSPYSASNLLTTIVKTSNAIVESYAWASDFRTLNLVVNTDMSSFITEWKIPVDGDKAIQTKGVPNTTIKLPIAANGINFYTVDWGDGSSIETFDSSSNFPTHTYTNTQEEIYTIKINGTVNAFGYTGEIVPTSDNISSEYYTFTQYIVQIIQWGEIECRQYGFANCLNLTGEIVLPSVKSFREITSFYNLFANCSRLTGSIPEGIFKNATKANNFSGTFLGCQGLTGTIPNGLVAYSNSITRMNKMFYGCKNLTGSIPRDLFTSSNMTGNIPEDLFDKSNTSNVMDYSAIFYDCKNLSGSIPNDLFSKAENATDFSYAFYGCENLSGNISAELFASSPNVTTFRNTFTKCSGLTGEIPSNLFSNNQLVLSFQGVFEDCKGLTGSVPETLFANNVKAENFDSIFKNCVELKGSIPNNLFIANTKATTFYYAFGGCTGLTGTLPQNLFASNLNATNFSYTFYNCMNLTGEITEGLFPNNISLMNVPTDLNENSSLDAFNSTFYNCGKLTSVGLNTLYVGYEMFKNCNKIIDVKIGDNVTAIATNSFYVGTPFSNDNLLPTNLTSNNEIAINYNWESNNRTIVDPESLIMEWTVPENTTIKLPIMQHTNNNFTVNWGDGTTLESFDSTANFPTHTYTSANVYTIEIKGSIEEFGYFNGDIIPTQDNEAANYYSFTKYLTKIIRWGNLNVSKIAFANCTNLAGEIPIPTIEEFANLISVDYLFYNCASLTGDIPANLFSKATKLETVIGAFSGCTGLTGNIPVSLFEENTNLKDVSKLFANSTGFGASIPEMLFANNKQITTFEETFKNCTQIEIIPENLFVNNINVTEFDGLFNGCTGITNIPKNLFKMNTKVTSFAWAFANCTGITKLPDELFSTNVNVNNYKGTFYYCSGLDYIISTDIFASSTAINSVPTNLTNSETEDAFSQTFEGCSNIELVTIDLLYIGYRMFYNCNNLVEFIITNKIQAIGTDAFETTSPYGASNLLTTTLDSSNSVVTGYNWTGDYRYVGNALITSWTIPAGGTTIKLPIPSNSTNSFTVNWGDGKTNSYTTTAFPSHQYTNTSQKTYDITITGKIHTFGYIQGYAREPSATSYSDYYTFTQYLTGIKAWGNLGISTYGFAWCKNLTGRIPIAVAGTFKNVTTMYNLFYHCENLEGPIPQGLFNSATNVTEFYTAFGYCYDLKGPIPANLFAKSTQVQSFYSVFYNCPSLDGSIPKGLFANSTEATNFMSAFGACSSLTGPIPDDIFDNCIKGTNFTSVFSGCKNLSGSIPAGLFANTKGETFTNTFHSCANLTGTIPEDMFPSANTVTNIQGTFYGCEKLVGGELKVNTTNVTTVQNLFYNCKSLENITFGKDFKKFDGKDMFYGTESLEKIIFQNVAATTSAVATLGDLATIVLGDKVIAYVPNRSTETIYESAWNGKLSKDRIKPMLKLVGEETEAYLLNEPYIDKGVSVADYINENARTISPKLGVYGYEVTQTYNNVDIKNVGIYEVEYTLTLDGTVVDTITRGSVIITVPPTKPTLTVTNEDGVVPSNTWSNKELTVEITGSTLDGPGGIEYRYSYDEKTWYKYENPYVYANDTADTILYVKAINNHDENFSSEIITYEIKLDTTAPTEVVLETTPTATTITAEVTNVDGSVAGVKEYEFYINGELKSTQTDTIFVFQNLEYDTNYTIGVKVRDNLDNVTDLITKEQKTNEDPTIITLIPNTKIWTKDDVIVTIEWPVLNVTKQIKIGDGEWQEYNDAIYAVTENTTLAARVLDGESVLNSASLTIENIDKKVPTITLPENIVYSKSIQITLNDEISGVNGWQITTSEQEPTNGWISILPTMNSTLSDTIIRNVGTYYVWTKDQAGNIGKTAMEINKKDLVVTPTLNQSKKLNDSDPEEFTYSYTEQESGQIPKFDGKLSRVPGENAGKYLYTLGTLTLLDNLATNFEAQNYNLVLDDNEIYFEIEPINLVIAEVSLTQTEYIYNGKEQEINPTVVVNGTTLVKDIDYDIEYENNTYVGTATATIVGIANYSGTFSKEFSIVKRPVTITALPQTIVKDKTIISQDVSNAVLENAGEGDTLTSIVLKSEEVTEEIGTITPSDAIINKGDIDVTENYEITYVTGELTITKHYYAIAENTFETLIEAISEAQSGDTIKVLQDVPNEISDAIVNKNIILDTNGFVLNKATYPITINNNYSLQVIGTGKIAGGIDCNTVLNKGTLELTDATIENISGSNAYFAINNSGTVNINSGTVSSTRETIKNNGTLNMYAGKVIAETTENVYPFGIKQQSSTAKLNITGGEIIAKGTATGYGSRGIQIEGGDLLFENAKVLVEDTSNAMGITYWCSSNGRTGNITINSGVIEVESGKDAYGLRFGASGTNIMQVTTLINGGTITVNGTSNAEAISSFSNTGTIDVFGGTFTSNQYGIRADDNLSSLIIGDKNININNTTPEIYGDEYGIFLTKGFTFNNGIIKGTNQIPYQGEVTPRSLHYMVETSGPEGNVYSAYLAFNSEKALIMEWTIPADADKTNGTTTTNASGDTITLGAQTTIKLPIPAHANNNYTVDWGDGIIETFDSNADFPIHIYNNVVETVYTIKITGTLNQFGYVDTSYITETGTTKNYYTFSRYLTGLKQWGELNAKRYGFSDCDNLKSTIPMPMENSFKQVTSMSNLFYACSNLTGEIPENLFLNATEVTSFSRTFWHCRNLTGNIPDNLFNQTTKVTSFSYTFYNCSGLTGTIPEKLFETTTAVTSFESTFSNCYNLSGSIPKNLFKTTVKARIFMETFKNCRNLTGSIPSELFATTIEAVNMILTFSGCTGLTGNIPAELFNKTPKIETFKKTFENCTGLTGEIPATLFRDTPLVEDFSCCFYNCMGLSGHVSEELFASNTAITTIPQGINTRGVLILPYMGTFYNCSNLTSASINTLYVDIQMFYGCNKLTDITIGDKVQAIVLDAFEATEPYNSSNLLVTKLTTTNEIAKNYDWLGDNRTDSKYIVKEPEDVNTKVRNEASFTVVASGDELKYQWYEVVSGDAKMLTEENTKIYKSCIEGKANTTSSTTIKVKSTENRKLMFEYMVSSENNGDLFTITVEDANGVVTAADAISGEVDWTTYEKDCVPTAAGEIIITLTYSKNATVDQGLDYGAIRNLKYSATVIKEFTFEEDENFEEGEQFAIINYPNESFLPFEVREENENKILEAKYSDNTEGNIQSVVVDAVNYYVAFAMMIEEETLFSFDYRVKEEIENQAEIINLKETNENRIRLLHDMSTELIIGIQDGNGQNMIYSDEAEITDGWVNYTTTLVPDENNMAVLVVYVFSDEISFANMSVGIKDVSIVTGEEDVSTFESDTNFIFEDSGWNAVGYEGVNSSTLTIPAELVTLNKNGNKYYCEVSNYMSGITTRKALLTVNDRRIEIDLADISYTKEYFYDGTPKTPSPIVMVEGNILVKGIDYRVDYENNIESGIGKLILTGIGTYKGIVEKEFIILLVEKEVNVTGATLQNGISEPGASDTILSTDTAWTKSKEFAIAAEDKDSKPIRIKIQDITNVETGYSFVDQYGITGRDDIVDPSVNFREYLFSGDVTGYVTIAINKIDEAGNETTEYLRIYNIDNTAPEIIMESKLEDLEETKVQVKDSGSGLRYFGITSATQVGEPMNVVETDTTNGIDVNTWYRVPNAAATDSTVLDAQDVTVTFPRLLSGKYIFWAKDLVGNVSSVEFEVSNRPLIVESSHSFDRPWYEQNNIIDMNLSTEAEKYELNPTLKGKDLIAKLTIKSPNGKVVNLSDNMKFTLNGLETNFVVNNDAFIYTVQSNLNETSFEKINNIKIDMTDLEASEYLRVGKNTIIVEYYIGENNVPEEKVTTYEIELEIRKYKYYSIVAKVNTQDGIMGEALLTLSNGVATSRTITLDYVGDLEEPYVTIKLQKKNGTNSNGVNQYEEITNNVTIPECNPLRATQEINANFAETLESGEYQLLFELYDKYDYKRATEALNFKVN